MSSVRHYLQHSSLAFGTSGLRGLASDFSEHICRIFTLALLQLVERQGRKPDSLVLAIDLRPSSERIASYCGKAAQAYGVKLVYGGVLPTPALALYCQAKKLPGIMVTGSHIPFNRNGLKFYTADGEVDKEFEKQLLEQRVQVMTGRSAELALRVDDKVSELYRKRYLNGFPHGALSGLRIGLYEHTSAGRDLYKSLFTNLGAEVISLARSETFVPLDTEAVSDADAVLAHKWQKEHNLDYIFSTDGDGDRPLLAGQDGTWLRGDELGLLCAIELGVQGLVVPVNCSTAIEKSARFSEVQRSKIGSPYVIAQFKHLLQKHTCVAGFEANGGFLLASELKLCNVKMAPLPTRDALLPALVIMAAGELAKRQERLPKRFTASGRLQDFAETRSKKLMSYASEDPQGFLNSVGVDEPIKQLDHTDGLRITLISENIIHIRPSGNAPEFRCYAESTKQLKADDIVTRVLQSIDKNY